MTQLKLFALLLTAWTVSLYSADGAGGGAVAEANSQVTIRYYAISHADFVEVSNAKNRCFLQFFLYSSAPSMLYIKEAHDVNNGSDFKFYNLGNQQLSPAQALAFIYACDTKDLPLLTASDIPTLNQRLEELTQAHNNFVDFTSTQFSAEELQNFGHQIILTRK